MVEKLGHNMEYEKNAIYKDDMKLNVAYSVLDNEVYFDDERDLGKYNHCHMTFCGIIGGDDVKGFVAFCRENGVEIEVTSY